MRRRVLILAVLVVLAVAGWWLGRLAGGGRSVAPSAGIAAAAAPGTPAAGRTASDGARAGMPAGPSWLDQIPVVRAGTAAVVQPGSPLWSRAIGPEPRRARPSASTAWVAMSVVTFDSPTDLDAFRELTAYGSQAPGTGFRVEGGRLRVDLATDFKALAMPMDESGDIRLTFDLEVDPGQEAGDVTVFWGAREPFIPGNPLSLAWNGYEAKLGAIGRMDHAFKRQGRETLATSASDVLQQAGSHAVEIEQHGGELRMWIDNQPVLTTVDGDPLESGRGVQVGILGHHLTGWVDNWTVHRPVTKAPN